MPRGAQTSFGTDLLFEAAPHSSLGAVTYFHARVRSRAPSLAECGCRLRFLAQSSAICRFSTLFRAREVNFRSSILVRARAPPRDNCCGANSYDGGQDLYSELLKYGRCGALN